VDVAADLGLWAAAEDIAAAAIERGEGGTAAETLVDAAMARSLFRQAQGRKRERNSQLQRLRSRPFSTRFG
jgi:hypothetical protein